MVGRLLGLLRIRWRCVRFGGFLRGLSLVKKNYRSIELGLKDF